MRVDKDPSFEDPSHLWAQPVWDIPCGFVSTNVVPLPFLVDVSTECLTGIPQQHQYYQSRTTRQSPVNISVSTIARLILCKEVLPPLRLLTKRFDDSDCLSPLEATQIENDN